MKKNEPKAVKYEDVFPAKKFSEFSKAELEDIYFTQNKSARMLAEEYGLTINQVRWVLKKAGLNKTVKMFECDLKF